ncbi:MAG TPA: hypothetical protein VJR30_07025 [Bradyrhizobium sp.]|nr:hypothetical protein [Bradyrhizobium sp.]
MSDLDAEEKARNREVAQNAQHREAVSAVRVSGWAIFITLVIASIVVGIVWAWTHR